VVYAKDSPVARFLAGEPELLGEVSRWISQVLAAASFWALRSEWKDLHQETIRRLIESLHAGRYDDAFDFKAYTQGVARKTALKALTRRLHTPPKAEEDEALDQAVSEEPEESRVVQQQLARQVLELATDDCRRLIVAYFLEGRAYEEIAAERDVPIGTVKSRLFRCLEAAHRVISRPKGPLKGGPVKRR
jgi:RNA polymerase sigma-70 factor (ECF subfamily)